MSNHGPTQASRHKCLEDAILVATMPCLGLNHVPRANSHASPKDLQKSCHLELVEEFATGAVAMDLMFRIIYSSYGREPEVPRRI